MRKVIPGFIVAITLIVSAILYPRLPDQIVTHWGMDGQPDGYSSRTFGTWLMPGIMFVVWVLMRFLPRIDPKWENYERFQGTYYTIITLAIGFMGVMHIAVLGSAAGWPISVPRVIPICIGLMFIVMGNLLPRARPNWFVGIRTPWTLSNDRIWERTHRLGGILFIISGLILAASSFGPPSLLGPSIIVAILLGAFVPFVYSLVLWLKERGKRTESREAKN